jgi:hypothetical protein
MLFGFGFGAQVVVNNMSLRRLYPLNQLRATRAALGFLDLCVNSERQVVIDPFRLGQLFGPFIVLDFTAQMVEGHCIRCLFKRPQSLNLSAESDAKTTLPVACFARDSVI